jgi:hypothetical protein
MSDSKPPTFERDNSPKDGTTIELGKILDLIGTKQTQYYALWAVYTAVQFSAANYGMGHEVSYSLALSVLAGFWAFNFGHLGFVLQCVRQLDRLKLLLKASVTAGKPGYSEAFREFVDNIGETDFFLEMARKVCRRSELFLERICAPLHRCLCVSGPPSEGWSPDGGMTNVWYTRSNARRALNLFVGAEGKFRRCPCLGYPSRKSVVQVSAIPTLRY